MKSRRYVPDFLMIDLIATCLLLFLSFKSYSKTLAGDTNSPSIQTGKDIVISFIKSGQRPGVRFISGSTVFEEVLDHEQMIGLYWSAGGYIQRENVASIMPNFKDWRYYPLNSFELEIDGQSLHDGWEWISSSQRQGERTGTVEAVVELRHKIRPVNLKVITRLDGSPILVRYLEITNIGKSPAALSNISPMTSMLWDNSSPYSAPHSKFNPTAEKDGMPEFSVGYFSGQRWGEEGAFTWQSLSQNTLRIEQPRLHQYGPPYFIVRNDVTGEMFFIGLAWSGKFFAEFKNDIDHYRLFFRAGPKAHAALRVIEPQETIKSSEIHIGPIHASFDSAVSKWYQHMRRSVIPPRPKGKEMYTLAARVVEEPNEWILREIDIAAEMGVEAFMVDAGWYGEKLAQWAEYRGDWNEGYWLPGGIAGVRDYVHRKKMLFGLWHEAEAMTNKTKIYKEHPDWSTFLNGEYYGSLNLANPGARKYFEDTVFRLIGEFKLDFYKLDYNNDVYDTGTLHIHESPSGKLIESESWRHNEAVYATYDKVRKEYPDVCLENCAGGGGRNDLGMLSRFHYACESDWSVFPYSILTINTMSLFVPVESICYYHDILFPHAHQMADMDTHLRVTLFAIPIFVGFGAQSADRTTEYFRETKRYIELNKTFCRKVMADHPVVYHHTPDAGIFSAAPWCVLEYARQDRTCGYAGVFRLKGGADDDEYVFRPRGIDTSKFYDVTLDNSKRKIEIKGWELAQSGIRIHLDTALTSELIMYEIKK